MSGILSKHSRRLTDNLLSAFNHAYAVGERDIAERLRAMLEEVERRRHNGSEKRGRSCALGRADLWVAFVDARDQYRVLCDARPESGKTQSALAAMKETYRRWSLG
ncbi:MAG: hypothetical protein HKM95_13105 [Inquilinus sp.]|nr:hypothetical protein [Inquilinus sp.]